MEAFVIALTDNTYSMRVSDRCIRSANIPVKRYPAINGDDAPEVFARYGLRWTWGDGFEFMQHKPYGGDHNKRVGCFLSHYELWSYCVRHNRELLILEHDAVFVRPFKPFDFDNICMINDPLGATPRGDWWSEQMEIRGPGVWPKTKVFDDSRPDGLAGNSAYVIKPHAAQVLLDLVAEIGAWPNDAIMCRQFMDLQEYYPFITEVRAKQSTI